MNNLRWKSDITNVPYINTKKIKRFSQCWLQCGKITTFPIIDTSSGILFDRAWKKLYSLTEFPILDLSNGKSFVQSWDSCFQLRSFPKLNISNGKTFDRAWSDCLNLQQFPPNMFDNLPKYTNQGGFYNTWRNCKLTTESIENILVSIDVSRTQPSLIQLDQVAYRMIGMSTELHTRISNKTHEAIKSLQNKKWIIDIIRNR